MAHDVRVESAGMLVHPDKWASPGEVSPMFGYSFSQNKIGVQIVEQLAPYWFSVSFGVLLVTSLVTVATDSLLVWVGGLTVSVCAWLLDVQHQRRTMDSWRPHIVFWPTMIGLTLFSGGVAGLVTMPGYALEKRIS